MLREKYQQNGKKNSNYPKKKLKFLVIATKIVTAAAFSYYIHIAENLLLASIWDPLRQEKGQKEISHPHPQNSHPQEKTSINKVIDKIEDESVLKNKNIENKSTENKNDENISLNNKTINNKIIPDFVSIKSSNVNVRSGPNRKAKIVTSIYCKNYPLAVISKFNRWYKVRTIDGREGWISENLVRSSHHAIFYKNYTSHWDEISANKQERAVNNSEITESTNNQNNENNTIKTNLSSGTKQQILPENNIAEIISDHRNATSLVLRIPSPSARPIAQIQLNSVVLVEKCNKEGWCKINNTNGNIGGWVPKSSLWGYNDRK